MWAPHLQNLLVLLAPLSLMPSILASSGDRSYIFQKCVRTCITSTCSHISDEAYRAKQPIPQRWLLWTCDADCGYNCMWRTVKAFKQDGSGVPQFYGKWPFVRMLGVQEPASTLFSFLNGLCHLGMLLVVRRSVPTAAPMFYVWHLYAAVAINAWFWAVVFHTRDFPFTELMDYICAVSLVVCSLLALIIRAMGPGRYMRWLPAAAVLLGLYIYHVHYLAFVKFDYGYNMKVNIAVGITSGLGWLGWCWRVRKTQPYAWKAATCIASLNVLVLLEVLDFPPLWWTLDAHSLWHLGTAPIPILWYSFVIDDCLFLLKEQTEAGVVPQGDAITSHTADPHHIKVS